MGFMLFHDENIELEKEGNYFNIIYAICEKLTARLKLNSEDLEAFLSQSRTREYLHLLHFQHNIGILVMGKEE